MNFKTHRKNRSFLIPYSERQKPERKSIESAQPNNNVTSLIEKAKHTYYVLKDFQFAITLFEQYLNIYPKNNEALYLCGVACLHINRSQEAIERLKLVTQDYQNHPNAMLLTAIAFNKLGTTQNSLDMMNSCINLYPQFQEALCFRGRLYMQMGCFMQAEMDFRSAASHKSSSFLSFMGLGDCYRVTSRFERAIAQYKKAQQLLKNSKISANSTVFGQLQLKISICLYFMQNYQQSLSKLYQLRAQQGVNGSQLYYYIGLCEVKLTQREKGLLSLQYCLKMQTNTDVIQKAYKRLLRLYLEDYQFYEAMNIVELGKQCGIKLQQWKKSVEAFMMVIKGRYEDALLLLNETLVLFKDNRERSSQLKLKDSDHGLEMLHNPVKIKLPDQPRRKMTFFDSPKSMRKVGIRSKSGRQRSEFYSKSVAKAITKIGSVIIPRPATKTASDNLRHKTQHVASQIVKTTIQKQKKQVKQKLFNSKQRQILYPLALKFKAYTEFFLGHYLSCMDTYDEYQHFVKEMFGKQSELQYNRLLCQGMLMAEEELADESLAKFTECVQCYFEKYKQIPAEPILYKLTLLVKLAAIKLNEQSSLDPLQSDIANSNDIIESTLKMIDNYKGAIADHHLSHYLEAIVFIMQEDYTSARQCLEKTLKLVEQCSWKFLYVKGVVEMSLSNYYGAVKEFSAGMILDVKPELFLGRAISFFMLSQAPRDKLDHQDMSTLMKSVSISAELTKHKNRLDQVKDWAKKSWTELLLENCFSDLQSYIQLSKDQAEISKWVSRLLFATKSYDQALSSIAKMQIQSEQFLQMSQCIQIYEGQFENGGSVGLMIKSALDGIFLQETEEKNLLEYKTVKNYNSSIFEYLTEDYQKWLVVLQLYIKENYPLLLKYLQRQLFSVQDEKTQLFLRYNICIIYLLLGEKNKVSNLAKSLLKFQNRFNIKQIANKLMNYNYDKDECIDELKQSLGIGENRLLSNFLPYRPINITNSRDQTIRVFARFSIPFPKFPLPNLDLKIDRDFILKQIVPNIVEKKIEAPWIRRMDNHMIQFTQNLQESKADSVQLSSKDQPESLPGDNSKTILDNED